MKKSKTSRVAGRAEKNGRDRIARLFLWLDEKLDHLEQRHLEEDDLSAAEHEKEARTMIALIRVYEKLVEMKEHLDEKSQSASQAASASGSAGQGYDGDEAERRRIEIAQRIERLQRQQDDAEGSGQS